MSTSSFLPWYKRWIRNLIRINHLVKFLCKIEAASWRIHSRGVVEVKYTLRSVRGSEVDLRGRSNGSWLVNRVAFNHYLIIVMLACLKRLSGIWLFVLKIFDMSDNWRWTYWTGASRLQAWLLVFICVMSLITWLFTWITLISVKQLSLGRRGWWVHNLVSMHWSLSSSKQLQWCFQFLLLIDEYTFIELKLVLLTDILVKDVQML